MNLSISGIYENGEIKLSTRPPQNRKQNLIVTFLPEEDQKPKKAKRILGQLEGKNLRIPMDFDQPLDELKDYM